ncbi:helix-turn-helix transcriptional regulator [Streptomyces sp. MUM 136J]|nr:helix-turn-helix transcriptional regulator [Streptomyces sp. MUM 2J]MCH0573460.1 helix-turn-helix transcriptional regulator [Streptomyces sp. MUM 136J]
MPKVVNVDNLFEVVVQVFAERGYDAATTQEIAARAGVSEVTLYRRYGSKAALIEAALTHRLSASPFGRVVAGGDVRADLAAIVHAYDMTNRAYGGAVLTLLTEIPRHPELRNALSALMPNLQNAARIIAMHQERGHVGPGDPLQKVVFLLSPLIATGLWDRSGAGTDTSELSPEAVVDAFLEGHRPSPS